MGQGPLTGAQAPYPWQHRWRYSGVWPCRPFPVLCQGLGRLHLMKVITVVLSSRVPRSHHSLKTAPPNTPPSGSYNLSGHFSEMPVATWKGWCTCWVEHAVVPFCQHFGQLQVSAVNTDHCGGGASWPNLATTVYNHKPNCSECHLMSTSCLFIKTIAIAYLPRAYELPRHRLLTRVTVLDMNSLLWHRL